MLGFVRATFQWKKASRIVQQSLDPIAKQALLYQLSNRDDPTAYSMSRQDPTSRAKPKPEGEEEATSVLNLGEFQNVDALSLSEASIITWKR